MQETVDVVHVLVHARNDADLALTSCERPKAINGPLIIVRHGDGSIKVVFEALDEGADRLFGGQALQRLG